MSSFTGWLTAKISVTSSLAGTSTNISSIEGVPKSISLIDGMPEINETDVLDVFQYFRTEDNKNFLVTESGEHLGFY